jgi:hypothetical protein
MRGATIKDVIKLIQTILHLFRKKILDTDMWAMLSLR